MRLIGVGLGAAVFLIGAAEAAAPDLSGLAPVARNSIERACSAAAKRSADAYADCLNKQLDGMKAGPAMPSLDSLSADARAKAEKACTNAFNRGPAAYATCLNEQVAGAQPATGAKTTAPATAARSAAFAWPAWQGQRPPMPAGLGKKELKPAEVFNAAAPSVYVVIAGKT
ncbi:MAG: hypothetical protein HY246_11750, partial [Proteobacteria bacterium]|nr:hypothetical protein [Pseudomonadota bacterium]